MHVILHLATSSDGFIAKPDGNSDWVSPSDEALFVGRVKDAGCVAIGKRTFDQYHGSIYPISGALNIVLTNGSDMPTETNVAVAHSPEGTLALAKEKGYENIVIAGGARTSVSFLDAGLIDEIFLSVHPIKLGTGMKPFEDISSNPNYTLVGQKQLDDGLTELHYAVI